jgi:hypothetical protein
LSDNPRIHSAYDPQKEAQKYIDSLTIPPGIVYFILIECGSGYMIPVLRAQFPSAKLISLHISSKYLSGADGYKPDAEWSPSSSLTCTAFLERHIKEIESDKIKIIEWRPALALDGKTYARILSETAAFIKITDANKRTSRYFAKRWQNNIMKNISVFSENALKKPSAVNSDIILCAAGPGLETQFDTLKIIRRNKNRIILSVSSAVRALLSHGITPDIVFTSDGGNWARFHLFETLRCPKKPLIAAPLNAVLLTDFKKYPVILFSDGSSEQNTLLAKNGLPVLSLPQRGTVTAAALDFALGWTTGNIYLTGADLSSGSLNSHARPYSFDLISEIASTRLSPFYHLKLTRTRALTAGGSHKIYAEWFKRQRGLYPSRIYSLGVNNEALSFKRISASCLLNDNKN